jgi:hypothetical protein
MVDRQYTQALLSSNMFSVEYFAKAWPRWVLLSISKKQNGN